MVVKADCPKCGVRLRLHEESVGTQVRCANCKRPFLAERALLQAPATPRPTTGPSGDAAKKPPRLSPVTSPGHPRSTGPDGARRSPLSLSDGVRVPTLLTGAIAFGATVLLSMVVFGAIPESSLARLLSHGAVSFFTAWFGLWAIAILFLKTQGIVFEKSALGVDLLAQEGEEVIRADNVHLFSAHLGKLPRRLHSSILFRRISRALEYFRSTGSPKGVSDYLNSQAELDVSASESSYTMVKVLIWAIPILGFIGTVSGIGEAVNSFAVSVDTAKEVETIRDSLGGVTSGLGTAFETTLVALIISILLMLPANWLEKTEDDLLTAVGSYSNEEFLWRLQGTQPGPATNGAALEETLERLSNREEGVLEGLRGSLGEMSEGLGRSLEGAALRIDEQIRARNEEHAERIEASLAGTATEFSGALAALSVDLDARSSETVAGLRRAETEAQARHQASAAALEKTLAQLLHREEGVLEELRGSLGETSDRLGQSLEAAALRIDEQVRARNEEHAARIEASLAGTATEFGGALAALSADLHARSSETVAGLLQAESEAQARHQAGAAALEKTLGAISVSATSAQEDQSRAFDEATQTFQHALQDIASATSQQMGEQAAAYRESTAELSAAIRTHAEQGITAVDELAGGLEQLGGRVSDAVTEQLSVVKAAGESVETSTRALAEQIDGFHTDGVAQMRRSGEAMAGLAEGLSEDLPQALGEHVQRIREGVEASAEMLEAQRDMRESFAQAARSESLEGLVQKIDETHGRLLEAQEQLGACFERMQRLEEERGRRWWRLIGRRKS